jgi:hypothetical protein
VLYFAICLSQHWCIIKTSLLMICEYVPVTIIGRHFQGMYNNYIPSVQVHHGHLDFVRDSQVILDFKTMSS